MARTRQPQGMVRAIIPRYADATVAINFAQLRNQGTIVTCQPILTGGATQRPNVGGIGAGPPDANGGYIALGTTAATQLNTQSGVICWVPTTTSAVAALFNSSFTAGANGFAINQLANGTVELSKHNTAAIVTTTNAANNNAVNTLAWSYTTAGTATVVLNGVVTSANSAQSLTHGDAVLGKYRSGDNAFCIAVLFNLFVLWPKTRSATELSYLCENPWSVFSSPRRLWVQLGAASGGAGATGTSAATLEGVTGTAVGTLAIAAASAATLGAVTGTAAGAAAIAGVSAQTLEETTGTAAATLAIAATSADTLAATVGTAAGTLAVAATSAQTLGAVTGTANGTTLGAASGTSAATLANTTGTAAGTLALAATSSATVGIVTGTSAGTISVGGASAQALSDVTGVAVGNTTGATNGVSIVTLDSVSGSAAGYADILATSAGALEAISGTAAGAISIIGVSADILADVTCGVPPPTLPLEVPTSSRTLAAAVIRLGASPLAAESPRLGATPVRKAPPRLG